MAIGLVGRKCGMTRIFTDAGVSVPVTVIEVDPNRITQIKTLETDGYQAIQITTGERRESRVTNAQKGHFAKAGVAAGRLVQEFRATEADLEGREVGGTIGVDMFTVGQVVDVTGQSKGKGFQGGVKRWNFRTQDATHGNSLSHRDHDRYELARIHQVCDQPYVQIRLLEHGYGHYVQKLLNQQNLGGSSNDATKF
jgi:large subunit ribosomal protein L3